MQHQINETLKDSAIIVQHKTVLHQHSATLSSATINIANTKSTTSNTEALKMRNINSGTRNTITLKRCNIK